MRTMFGQGAEGRIAGVDTRLAMEGMREEILDGVKARYDEKITALNSAPDAPDSNIAGTIVRHIILNTLDAAWREHLTGMDELRRGIGLRAIGQKDPLIEYQFESYNLFTEMMERVKETFCGQIMRVRILTERERQPKRQELHLASAKNAQPEARPAPARKIQKVGRNDPCPCGSGKKYKYCHGRGL